MTGFTVTYDKNQHLILSQKAKEQLHVTKIYIINLNAPQFIWWSVLNMNQQLLLNFAKFI